MNISPLRIASPHRADLPHLFALAQTAFASMPGLNAARVARPLDEEVVFVARKLGAPAAYVALPRQSARSLLVGDREVTRSSKVKVAIVEMTRQSGKVALARPFRC